MNRPTSVNQIPEIYREGLHSDLYSPTIPGWRAWRKTDNGYVPTTVNAYKEYDFPTDAYAPPDYTPNWKVPDKKRAAFEYEQGWSGGGVFRGTASELNKWTSPGEIVKENDGREGLLASILEADKRAKAANPVKNVVFSPGVYGKAALNNFTEMYDRGLNTWADWRRNDMDESAFNQAKALSKKLGKESEAFAKGWEKTTKIGRKSLLTFMGPGQDILDFGLRVAEGKNIARAGAEATGSIAGWELGVIPGKIIGGSVGSLVGGGIGSLLAPFTGGASVPVGAAIGRVVGSFAGGYLGGSKGAELGEGLTTKAYEAVTDDDWERRIKPQQEQQERQMKDDWSKELARQMALRRQEHLNQLSQSTNGRSWFDANMQLEY